MSLADLPFARRDRVLVRVAGRELHIFRGGRSVTCCRCSNETDARGALAGVEAASD